MKSDELAYAGEFKAQKRLSEIQTKMQNIYTEASKDENFQRFLNLSMNDNSVLPKEANAEYLTNINEQKAKQENFFTENPGKKLEFKNKLDNYKKLQA